ncbi:hypothetical protein [Vampirovibrio sp.]|uniref:hypothetical protein n=1 Tax=Vampirovibrio sp. TaxID=2717857 RepID=UPI003593FB7A
MREIDGWRFLGYYGVIYLLIMIVIVVCYPLAQTFAKPIASLVFPIAGNNSLFKNMMVTTGMYWGALLFYTLVIQKIRLKF